MRSRVFAVYAAAVVVVVWLWWQPAGHGAEEDRTR